MLKLDERSQSNGHERMKYEIAERSMRPHPRRTGRLDRSVMWGAGLIVVGGLTLLAMITNWSVLGLAILPVVAVFLLVAGFSYRSPGLLVPAGILSGLSIGAVLASLLEGKVPEDTIGGIVLLSLGAGFALVVGLHALAKASIHWWPWIPAVLLSILGVALITQGQDSALLALVGYLWPVALLALGVWIVLRGMRRSRPD